MLHSLKSKVVLVTGGSTGIGRASALAFYREGAKVVVADVNVEEGNNTIHLIRENGGDAVFWEADISKAQTVETLVDKIADQYGRLDCALNNAGVVGAQGLTADCTEENWDHIIGVNLKGTWLCMKYEIRQMLKQGSGSIVNVSSVTGSVGYPTLPAYVTSKHGIVGLTKVSALEYAKSGIRINAVCPGYVRTPMLEGVFNGWSDEVETMISQHEPVGRVGKPEEIAEAVLWLSSDAASFVTGHAMAVDGGFLAQ